MMGTLTRWAREQARTVLDTSQQMLDRVRWSAEYARPHDNFDRLTHIREAADWIKRAQDSGTDRGVAQCATLGRGFNASYPETTGYIIPTFLDLADFFHDVDYERRAIEMGDWEISIQMDCGAVMTGKVNATPTPAVFNTGQVLLGWSALYRRTGERRFLDAARRAADWMIEVQEPNGNWIKGNSSHANPHSTLYNVKAAWGLLEAARAGNWDEAERGALRAADYCLSRQKQNGWFADCCLSDPTQPLLHTIAYSMQGLMGIARITNRPDCREAAARTANSLVALMDNSGFIPGRINEQFFGTVDWCCLTGTAQTSIVWSQLYEDGGDTRYRDASLLANRYLMARHNITSVDSAFRGGVFGSWPFWGGYGRNRILNWAVKFFLDALLLEDKLGHVE